MTLEVACEPGDQARNGGPEFRTPSARPWGRVPNLSSQGTLERKAPGTECPPLGAVSGPVGRVNLLAPASHFTCQSTDREPVDSCAIRRTTGMLTLDSCRGGLSVTKSGIGVGVAALLVGCLFAAHGPSPSAKADLRTTKVSSVTVDFGSGGAYVAWKLIGTSSGLATRVTVQLEGYEAVQVVPQAGSRNIQVPMNDLIAVAVTPARPARIVSARITLVDRSGRVISDQSGTKPLSQLSPPQGVTAESDFFSYRVKWSKLGLDRKLVVQVIEWDLVTGRQKVAYRTLAYLGRASVQSSIGTHLVQLQFVAANAFSTPWPATPLRVASKDPVPTDVTPPASPCCLNWVPGAGSLTVSWNPADHLRAVGFLITYGTSPGNVAVARVPISGAAYYTITGLQPKTRYTVTVASFDSAGNVSPPSEPQEYVTE